MLIALFLSDLYYRRRCPWGKSGKGWHIGQIGTSVDIAVSESSDRDASKDPLARIHGIISCEESHRIGSAHEDWRNRSSNRLHEILSPRAVVQHLRPDLSNLHGPSISCFNGHLKLVGRLLQPQHSPVDRPNLCRSYHRFFSNIIVEEACSLCGAKETDCHRSKFPMRDCVIIYVDILPHSLVSIIIGHERNPPSRSCLPT
jgi:hypothetical protein